MGGSWWVRLLVGSWVVERQGEFWCNVRIRGSDLSPNLTPNCGGASELAIGACQPECRIREGWSLELQNWRFGLQIIRGIFAFYVRTSFIDLISSIFKVHPRDPLMANWSRGSPPFHGLP
jgi:hypothetical protein